MWFAIIGLMLSVFALGLIYISFRAARFTTVRSFVKGRKWLARLLCLSVFAALTGFLWLIWNMMNAVVCMLHLMLFWAICDLVSLVIGKIRNKKTERYWAGAAAIALCALWLTWGWIADHHVWTTVYTFETDKLDKDFRIVQISDSHIGATFDSDGFLSHIEKINALKPDLVAVTGDFVDDDTSRDNMLASCDALGKIDAPYGVVFVFGNHDNGYYSAGKRGWTAAELRSRLEENGVIILEDKLYDAGGRLIVAGRKDRSRQSRLTAGQLLENAESGKYIVVLDHQPNDFDSEAAAGADLVLCGHTHGGQFIPINHVGEWIGENDLRYGHEKRRNTDFIVSPGISNWTFKFKTGCRSEYVVIDILAK
jgi:Predicted phosphohydrolases